MSASAFFSFPTRAKGREAAIHFRKLFFSVQEKLSATLLTRYYVFAVKLTYMPIRGLGEDIRLVLIGTRSLVRFDFQFSIVYTLVYLGSFLFCAS